MADKPMENVNEADGKQSDGLPTEVTRATTRPDHLRPPAHWKADPAPEPQQGDAPDDKSPTRYGDWVYKGIAIDFS